MIKLVNLNSDTRKQIVSLWHSCFGDTEEYINFFLDNCPDYICIGYFIENQLVSMLFLLNGKLIDEKCKYLYAACTDEKHRKQGIMEKLIKFTALYCSQNDIAAIFLVPATENLYSYYSKFGYISSFKKKKLALKSDNSCTLQLIECIDIDSVCKIKETLLNNVAGFMFESETLKYTVKEHYFNGGKSGMYSSDELTILFFYYIENNNLIIKEMLSDDVVSDDVIIKLFSNNDIENIYIYTPLVYNNKDMGEEYTKCGMCLPLNEKLSVYLSQNSSLYAGMYLD